MKANENFKSGFVCIIGEPNVGKSTLLNRLLGEKIAIISKKPQTTRNKITGIYTEDSFQIVFLDTPGIHKPKHRLGGAMVKAAESAVEGVDCILFLITPTVKMQNSLEIIEKLKKGNCPVFLIINKSDEIEKGKLLPIIEKYQVLYDFKEIIPMSALTGDNCDELIPAILKYLPKGPKYFPDDMITDQPERQIAAEIIREKALMLLQDELPHGIAVEIVSVKKRENRDMLDIDANLYCEKDSHKAMIIGKQGSMLKNIGSRARTDIERLFGSKVNLQIWIKVKNNWRDSDFFIKNFGFENK